VLVVATARKSTTSRLNNPGRLYRVWSYASFLDCILENHLERTVVNWYRAGLAIILCYSDHGLSLGNHS